MTKHNNPSLSCTCTLRGPSVFFCFFFSKSAQQFLNYCQKIEKLRSSQSENWQNCKKFLKSRKNYTCILMWFFNRFILDLVLVWSSFFDFDFVFLLFGEFIKETDYQDFFFCMYFNTFVVFTRSTGKNCKIHPEQVPDLLSSYKLRHKTFILD